MLVGANLRQVFCNESVFVLGLTLFGSTLFSQFDCEDMNNITVCHDGGPPPPLTVMSLNIRATPIPKSHDNQITMIGCLIHTAFYTDKAAPKPPYKKHFCCNIVFIL